MNRKTVSQEELKILATVTMLIDHIGAILVYEAYLNAWNAGNYALSNALVPVYQAMRIIGRVAFPIYCFLLVEGFYHTKDVKKYMKRLFRGLLLSEIPFDLAFSGRLDWTESSVMVTLLAGCAMMFCMERLQGYRKILPILPAAILCDLLGSDYGGHGIAIIAMLYLTRGIPREKLWRALCFPVVLWFGATITVAGLEIPMELVGLVSLIPIFGYEGRKLTTSKWIRKAFYLFYPMHLLALWGLERLIYG